MKLKLRARALRAANWANLPKTMEQSRERTMHDWLAGYRAAVRDAAKARRKPVAISWVSGGHLGNGHCEFMLGNFNGPCCCRHHGHEGEHMTDSQASGSGGA